MRPARSFEKLHAAAAYRLERLRARAQKAAASDTPLARLELGAVTLDRFRQSGGVRT